MKSKAITEGSKIYSNLHPVEQTRFKKEYAGLCKEYGCRKIHHVFSCFVSFVHSRKFGCYSLDSVKSLLST